MENDAEDGALPSVARTDAEAELERLLADSRFHLSDRNRAFLRYLAEANFTGQSRGVKAYSVAIDVFGRPSNFDPNTDPIVRIEATRLRTSLEQYYEAFGQETSVRIEVPRGSYIARFYRTARSVPPPQQPASPEPAAVRPAEPVAEKSNTTAQTLAIVLGALFVVVVGLVLAIKASIDPRDAPVDYVDKPVVTLLRSASAASDPEKGAIEENLLAALSRFEGIRVRSESDLGPSRALRRGGGMSEGGTEASEYEIVLRYKRDNGANSLRWRVLDADSGEALASGSEVSTAGRAVNAEAVADKIAVQLAADGGILGSLEIRKRYAPDAVGNICVLRAERALNGMDLAVLLDVSSCLRATISADNTNSEAQATLARVLVAQDEISGNSDNMEEASTLADRAAAIDSASQRSLIARMVVLYAEGQRDAARSTGREAVALNPLDVEGVAAFALRLYLSGERQEAMQTLRPLLSTNLQTWDGEIVRALDAYLNQRHAEAIAQLDGMVNEDSLASALRIASFLCLNQRDNAKLALERAAPQHPARFLDHISNILAARRVDPSIRAKLMGDIAQIKDWDTL